MVSVRKVADECRAAVGHAARERTTSRRSSPTSRRRRTRRRRRRAPQLAVEAQRRARRHDRLRRGREDDLPARLAADQTKAKLPAAIERGDSSIEPSAGGRRRERAIRRRWCAALLAGVLLCAGAPERRTRACLGIRLRRSLAGADELECRAARRPARARDREQALLAYRSVDDTASITGALNRVGNLRQRTGDSSRRARHTAETQSLAAVTGNGAEEGRGAATSARSTRRPAISRRPTRGIRRRCARSPRRPMRRRHHPQPSRPAGTWRQGAERDRAARSGAEIDRDAGNEAGRENRLRNLGAGGTRRGTARRSSRRSRRPRDRPQARERPRDRLDPRDAERDQPRLDPGRWPWR